MDEREVILRCSGLCKAYGRHQVLEQVDVSIRKGDVFGLLGPNGAGKTTLIKILLGLAKADGGQVNWFGDDLKRHRKRILRRVGAVVEAPIFFEYMTAWDNLRYLARLSGSVSDQRIDEALETVSLGAVKKQRVATFSYGMKQRLGIAQALLPQTEFLILDEPTNGLDPHGIAGMRELIQRLSSEQQVTILLSSHLLSEVEQVCDHAAIIHRGRKVWEQDVGELLAQGTTVTVVYRPGSCPEETLQQWLGSERQTLDNGWSRSDAVMPDERVPEMIRELAGAGMEICEVRKSQPSLENLFIQLTRGDDVQTDSIRN